MRASTTSSVAAEDETSRGKAVGATDGRQSKLEESETPPTVILRPKLNADVETAVPFHYRDIPDVTAFDWIATGPDSAAEGERHPPDGARWIRRATRKRRLHRMRRVLSWALTLTITALVIAVVAGYLFAGSNGLGAVLKRNLTAIF